MIDTILFDLDGTLLNMDLPLFGKIYFDEMALAFDGLIDKQRLSDILWKATGDMIHNIEHRSNRSVFVETFQKAVQGDIEPYMERFDSFYQNGYMKIRQALSRRALVPETLDILKQNGYDLILATNPLFPYTAVHSRILWGGMAPAVFSYVSHFDNSSYCKPRLEYYKEILYKNNKRPENCMMVGNDVEEDMVAGTLGLRTYLVDDQIISREHKIACDYRGSFKQFYEFIKDSSI